MYTNIKLKTLELAEYLALVDMIAEGYFDTNGEYQPQWGEINAIRLFYSMCVENSQDIKSLVGDEMKSLLNDYEFMETYNNTITHNDSYLTFGTAYEKAMKIVDTKKSSIGTAINVITSAIKDVTDGVKSYMTKENLGYLSTIAKEINSGQIGAEAVVNAYLKQKETKE